jgi:predicted permease
MSLRIFLARLFNKRYRRSVADLDEVFSAHLEMAAAELRAQGMSQEEAEREARVRFGGVTQQRETYRQQMRPPLIDSIAGDVRYAARQLRRNPGFATVAILTLALGIGATTAIYSLVQAVLLRSLPYGHADRLVYLYTPIAHFNLPIEGFTPSNADFLDIRRLNHSFASMTLFGLKTDNLATPEDVQRVDAATVDANFFSTLEAAPALGRVIDAEDNQPGRQHVAVISQSLWHSLFADSPDVLNHSVMLNGSAYHIVGVMSHEFEYPTSDDSVCGDLCIRSTQVWIPLALTPQQAADRDNANLYAVARLKPGVSRAAALDEMSSIMRHLDTLHSAEMRGWGAALVSFRDSIVGPVRPLLGMLFGAVCCVLLVACGNAANLLLARAAARHHEFGVRAALGAGRVRMARQLLTEALLLSGIAGIAGIALAWFFVRLLLRLDPGDIPRLQQTSIDPSVLLFAAGLVMITCLLFGTLPAMSTSRVAPADVLQSGKARGTVSARGHGRSLLIVGQVTVVVLLLAGSGLLVRSYLKVVSVKTGFAPSTATFSVTLEERYSTQQERLTFIHRLLDRIAAVPGVRASGAINILPLSHAGSMSTLWVEGYPNNDKHSLVENDLVTPRYFSAMNVPHIAGRDFTDADRAGTPAVVVVNQSFERRYFPGQSAVGKRLRTPIEGNPPLATIVGVVGDVRGTSLEEAPAPQIYSSFWQGDYSSANFAIRSSLPSTLVVALIRDAVRAVDPTLAPANIQTMQQLITTNTSRRRFQTTLLALFASVALLLTVIGLYGVLSYSVRQRIPEIGVRIALGATRTRVISMVVYQGLRLVLIGLVLGLTASFVLVRFVSSALYGVRPYDPWTFLAAPALVLLAALLACCTPAWRAAHIEPVQALRSE